MHRLDPNHLLANLRVVLVEAPNYVKNSLLASMSLPSTGSMSSQMPDLASQMVLSWMPRGCGFLGKYDMWASLAPAHAIILSSAHKTSPGVQRLFHCSMQCSSMPLTFQSLSACYSAFVASGWRRTGACPGWLEMFSQSGGGGSGAAGVSKAARIRSHVALDITSAKW